MFEIVECPHIARRQDESIYKIDLFWNRINGIWSEVDFEVIDARDQVDTQTKALSAAAITFREYTKAFEATYTDA